MNRLNVILVLAGVLLGLTAAARLPLWAQGDGKAAAQPTRTASIQEALLKPYSFRFGKPVTLKELAQRLSRDLGGPVVIDLAAIDRLDLQPDETVKLELDGVRLQTGLKLLLDQVGMTYRVAPEDNLLILTDKEGADDPIDRLAAEIHELHRDIHDIQDALDEVREQLGLEPGDSAVVRKPTIIEEMPENGELKSKDAQGIAPVPVPTPEPRRNADPKPRVPSARPRTRL